MTGMQLSWRYTQDVKIHHANNDTEKNLTLRRLVDLYLMFKSEDLWAVIKRIKVSAILNNSGLKLKGQSQVINSSQNLLDVVEAELQQMKIVATTINSQNISDLDLKTAFEIYMYLFNYPRFLWSSFYLRFLQLLEDSTPKQTLLFLSNFEAGSGDYFQQIVKKTLLTVLSENMGYNFINFGNASFLNNIQRNNVTSGIDIIY